MIYYEVIYNVGKNTYRMQTGVLYQIKLININYNYTMDMPIPAYYYACVTSSIYTTHYIQKQCLRRIVQKKILIHLISHYLIKQVIYKILYI